MRRRFQVVMLVIVLCLAAVASSGFLFSGSVPLAVGREFKPTMRVPAGVDADSNRVDDRLDSDIVGKGLNGTDMEPANVIVMLSGDTVEGAAAGFAGRGGVVSTELWRYALYGFGGRIPFGRIVGFVNSRSDVLLVEKEAECHANLAYAAQQVGARSYVWNTLSLLGDPNRETLALAHATNTFKVPLTFASKVKPGFATENGTLTTAAK